MRQQLHIYAVNERVEGRHTFLSRARGEGEALPDLAGWLGLPQDGLNTDEIELFPVGDLAGMALTDYVQTAFDLQEAPGGQIAARMNALEGHVLLIPQGAVAGDIKSQPQVTEIASLPMAQPDHSAAALKPASQSDNTDEGESFSDQPAKKTIGGRGIAALIVIGLIILFFVLVN